MRTLAITGIVLLMGSISQAEIHNFNSEIKEASISEKMLRKKLLRILQGTEVAVAANDEPVHEKQMEQQTPSTDFEVRLVKASKTN